jgi:FkbM family methyltransferase
MIFIRIIKSIFNSVGLDIKRYPSHEMKSRKKFMEYGSYDLVIDVGANVGQYVDEIRNIYKYKKRIVSFEPIKNAFDELTKRYNGDKLWEGFNFALGDSERVDYINISKHSASSSILKFNDEYLEKNKELDTVGKEGIHIFKLDDIFDKIIQKKSNNVLIKIDTQGYDKKVLIGAEKSLKKIKGIQIELSIKELYSGEALFLDVMNYLKIHNFDLYSLEPYYYDPNTHELLQVEAYFLNNNLKIH